MVQHVRTTSEFDSLLRGAGGALVVVDFSASWCGPCRRIEPVYNALAGEHPDVKFAKVMEDDARELILERGVRGFPTFHFYLRGDKIDELVGADEGALRAKIVQHKAKAQVSFQGKGMVAGGGAAAAADPEEMRRLRLARLAGGAGGAAPAAAAAPKPAAVFAPNPAALEQLTMMGFSPNACIRALYETGNSDEIQYALDWIEEQTKEGANLDLPLPKELAAALLGAGAAPAATSPSSGSAGEGGAATASSSSGGGSGTSPTNGAAAYSADELSAIAAAEAAGSGADGAGAPRKMTVEEAKAFVERRRAEKALKAKEDARLAEIKRREDGAKKAEIQEEIAKATRIREAEARKREAEEQRKEKHRLQVELLKDKAERYTKRGEAVPAELAAQIAAAVAAYNGLSTEGSAGGGAGTDPRAVFKASLASLAAFKSEGRGLRAAQTIRTLLKNPLEKPEEAKFRSINLANAAIKERVIDVMGGLRFLKAAGFVKDEATNTLQLSDADRKEDVLRAALEEIDAAVAAGIFN